VVAAVLARNPAIKAARARIQAVEAEHTELDALMRVRAQYSSFTDQLDPAVSARLPRASGSDAYPLPGAEGLRARLIDQAVSIARAALQSTTRQLLFNARATFARALYQQERVQILRDQWQLAKTLLGVMKSRFETGNSDLGSVLALEERVARLADARDDTESQVAVEQATLAQLMAVAGGEEDGTVGTLALPADLDSLEPAISTDELLGAHPASRMLELKRERLGTMAELIETLARPDTDLDLSELPSPLDDRPEFRQRPVQMPPGPWYGLMEARRAELASRAESVRQARSSLIDQLRSRAIGAEEKLVTARAELELQEKTLDGLARQAISATTEAFRTGRIDVDRVLAALTQRLDASLGASMARRDIAISVAESDYLLGSG
jgi:Outer membrane efflux protein